MEMLAQAGRVAPVSWGTLAIVTTLGGLSAVYVALTPAADQTPLNGRTWQEFATTDPEVASIVARLLVVLGLLGVGFAAVAALVSLFAYRRGARWAWFSLWLVPRRCTARSRLGSWPMPTLSAISTRGWPQSHCWRW